MLSAWLMKRGKEMRSGTVRKMVEERDPIGPWIPAKRSAFVRARRLP